MLDAVYQDLVFSISRNKQTLADIEGCLDRNSIENLNTHLQAAYNSFTTSNFAKSIVGNQYTFESLKKNFANNDSGYKALEKALNEITPLTGDAKDKFDTYNRLEKAYEEARDNNGAKYDWSSNQDARAFLRFFNLLHKIDSKLQTISFEGSNVIEAFHKLNADISSLEEKLNAERKAWNKLNGSDNVTPQKKEDGLTNCTKLNDILSRHAEIQNEIDSKKATLEKCVVVIGKQYTESFEAQGFRMDNVDAFQVLSQGFKTFTKDGYIDSDAYIKSIEVSTTPFIPDLSKLAQIAKTIRKNQHEEELENARKRDLVDAAASALDKAKAESIMAVANLVKDPSIKFAMNFCALSCDRGNLECFRAVTGVAKDSDAEKKYQQKLQPQKEGSARVKADNTKRELDKYEKDVKFFDEIIEKGEEARKKAEAEKTTKAAQKAAELEKQASEDFRRMMCKIAICAASVLACVMIYRNAGAITKSMPSVISDTLFKSGGLVR